MGEYAEMIINGLLCQGCNELIDEDEPGYPRYCYACESEDDMEEDDETDLDTDLAESLESFYNNDIEVSKDIFPKTHKTLERIIKKEIKKYQAKRSK